jgi:ATP-binding cassette, subfamily B, bacterial PglK
MVQYDKTVPLSQVSALRKLWRLIPRAQRRQVPVLIVSLLVGTGLEVVGIGLLVPLVNLLTNKDVSPENSILSGIFRMFGSNTQVEMLTIGFVTIGIVVLLKNVYLTCTNYFQHLQISRIRTSIETQLFKGYLYAEHNFHLRTNSSTLSRNIITEVDQITMGILSPALSIALEGLTATGIILLLVIVEPLASIALITFFGLCGVVYLKLVGKWLHKLGSERANLRSEAFKVIAETLGAVKQIKVLGREEFFLSRFVSNSRSSVNIAVRTDTMQRVPAYLIEFWGICGLIVVVFALLLQGYEATTVVSTLSLFAGSSFRLIPSLNRILVSSQTIKLTKSAIDVVSDEIWQSSTTKASIDKIEFSRTLEFRDVSFSYESQSTKVLEHVNLLIRRGESLGIVGPSGAGKSTLVDLLLGLLPVTGGQVLIDGVAIRPSAQIWNSNVGYVTQDTFLIDDSIRNNIAIGISPDAICDSKLLKSVSAAQMSTFISSLPDGLNTVVGERGVRLSGGQRQRIGIARALYHEPSLLILDEATSALDLETESKLVTSLATIKEFVTMVVISHRLSTLGSCDRIIEIRNGALTEIEQV